MTYYIKINAHANEVSGPFRRRPVTPVTGSLIFYNSVPFINSYILVRARIQVTTERQPRPGDEHLGAGVFIARAFYLFIRLFVCAVRPFAVVPVARLSRPVSTSHTHTRRTLAIYRFLLCPPFQQLTHQHFLP